MELPRAKMFADNRSRAADAIENKKSYILMVGGKADYRYLSDVEKEFRQESNFHYMTGYNKADSFFVMDVETKESTLVIPFLSLDDAVWFGNVLDLEKEKIEYKMCNVVTYTPETLSEVLRGVMKKDDCGILMMNAETKTKLAGEAKEFVSKMEEKINTNSLLHVLWETRIIKSPEEIELLRESVTLSALAHRKCMENAKSFTSESQVDSLFLYECAKKGERVLAYQTIAAGGTNAAVLHYGSNKAPINAGDLICVDAGIEKNLYASDITRTFPQDGKYSKEQREIYQLVLDAQYASMGIVKDGIHFVECYDKAIEVIIEGLVKLEIILKKDKTIQQLKESRIGAVFMPHGLGHSMGIDVHDVGGSRSPTHPNRLYRVLKKGMVLTVEPGCYFVPMLLKKAFDNPELAPHLNKPKIDEYTVKVGGVRIEDDMVVTEDGIDNLVDLDICPKEIDFIEKLIV